MKLIVVIILQYIYILNHYVIYLNTLYQVFLKKLDKD